MFYKIEDVSKRYQMSKSTIKNHVKNVVMPAPKKIGGSRRWSEEQLQEFDRQHDYLGSKINL